MPKNKKSPDFRLDYGPVDDALLQFSMEAFRSGTEGEPIPLAVSLALMEARPKKIRIPRPQIPKAPKGIVLSGDYPDLGIKIPKGKLGKPLANFKYGGGPEAHASRPLGNWQSDNAVDLMAPPGTPIYATEDGTVDPQAGYGFSSNGRTVWGNRLTLKGFSGQSYFYTHMGKLFVKKGARVKKGQLIGYVGDSPYFPPHLHFAVASGTPMDYV